MSLLLLAAISLLPAASAQPHGCPDCVSRSWSCPQQCKASDTKLHRFDFQYQERKCFEIIPWNSSSMQVDVDLWCFSPGTRRCRDFFCRHRRVGCDNMNQYAARGVVSSMGRCQGPPETWDLIAQNCQWVCKRGAPVVRCKYDFDRFGKFGIQSRLDVCWVQETCVQSQRRNITATCKPLDPTSSSPHVNLLGFATLLVRNISRFQAQPRLENALRTALVHLVSVSSSHVSLEVRRNATRSSGADNATKALHVAFNISVFGNSTAGPSQRAVGLQLLMEQANSSRITRFVNEALVSEGLEAAVLQADLTVSPGLQNLTAPGTSGQEFNALVALLRKYRQYLDEAHDDLQETHAEMNLQNLTRDEFATVQAKHALARQRLSQIMASHAELSDEIEAAIAQRNLTKHAVDVAQSAAQASADELVRLQANLSSSQADIAAMKEKHVEAEKALLGALAAKERLNDQLKVNTTRLGSSLEEISEDLRIMRKLLVDAQQANQSTHEELRNLEQELMEEQADHNVTKFALALEREDHELTQDELEEVSEQHLHTQWQLRSERQHLRETQQDLHDEEVQHLQTKAQLREVSKSASMMTLTFILVTACMSLLLIALATAFIVTLLRKRSVERIPVLGPVADGSSNVVVGRPIQPPQASDAWAKTVEIGTKPGPTLLTSSSSKALAGCLGSPMKKPQSIGDASNA